MEIGSTPCVESTGGYETALSGMLRCVLSFGLETGCRASAGERARYRRKCKADCVS